MSASAGRRIGVLLAPTLLALAACGTVAGASQNRVPASMASAKTQAPVIYLVRRKWHIDVGFAAADLRSPLKTLAAPFPNARYVFFGFGDRHYLLAKRRGASTTLGALSPGAGLILLTAIEGTPQEAFGATRVIEFTLTPGDSAAAQAFIVNSIAADSGTRDQRPFAPGPYEGSLYFSAVERYSALHTCNTWAAETLGAAGLPFRSRLVLFAGQLWSSAIKVAARERVPTRGRGDTSPAAADH